MSYVVMSSAVVKQNSYVVISNAGNAVLSGALTKNNWSLSLV
jgi:hypothetical protein